MEDRLSNLSTGPISLLEEIFEDANIMRTALMSSEGGELQMESFMADDERDEFGGGDLAVLREDADFRLHGRRHFDDSNDNRAVDSKNDKSLHASRKAGRSQQRKRKVQSTDNLSRDRSQRSHQSHLDNSRLYNSHNNSRETVHWQSLRQENELLRFKIAKLRSSLSQCSSSLSKSRSRRHLQDALSGLQASLSLVLVISCKQRMQVRAIFFFRWVQKSTAFGSGERAAESALRSLARAVGRSGIFALRRAYSLWRDETQEQQLAEQRETFLVLRKMSGIEKMRFVLLTLRSRRLRAAVGTWRSFAKRREDAVGNQSR